VIAVFYYVKVIKFMYLNEPHTMARERKPLSVKLALVIALIGVLAAGLFPVPFLMWIGSSLL